MQGCLGIVTGYSMGQVASQTADNILAEQAGQEFRYSIVISLDKTEIVDLARRSEHTGSQRRPNPALVPSKPMTRAKKDDIPLA